MSEQQGYAEQQQRLVIRAPLQGVVMEIADALTPGRWVNETIRLALLVQPDEIHIEAYLPEAALARINTDSKGTFYPQQADMQPVPVQISSIAQASLTVLEEPWQASSYEGDIPVREQPDGTLVPNQAIYPVQLLVTGDIPPIQQLLRGQVRIEGKPQSIVSRIWQAIAAVIIRESGF